MSTKLDEARRVAISLLDDLESNSSVAEAVLMKAQRLARFMRDTDAQTWLGYEMQGYPKPFSSSSLGTCEKYMAGSRRRLSDGKYYVTSLPELEANSRAGEATLNSLQKVGGSSTVITDFVAKRATEEFIVNQLNMQTKLRTNFAEGKALVVSIRSAVHSYATDIYLAIELGDAAQEIFVSARDDVDAFVRAHCPKAAEQLVAINERMADQSSESRTAALTTCRRLLSTVADSLFPAQTEDRVDAGGRKRKLGPEQYKNRLLAYLEDRLQSRGTQAVVVSDLEHLAARLDAIYEKASKGVHVEVTEQEARLAVIHTYLFVGELAEAARDVSPPSS